MADFYRKVSGNFDHLLQYLHNGILHGSISTSLESSREFSAAGCRTAVRVYERYAFLGANRMSLTLVLFQADKDIEVFAVGSGGSQAMFFKINTWSETGFAGQIASLLNNYRSD